MYIGNNYYFCGSKTTNVMAEILSYNPYRDMHGNVQFSAAFSGKNIQNIPIFNTSQTSVKEFDLYGFKVFTFTGKERDSETGFSYFGARYYDSDLMTDFWFLFGYVVGCW